MKVAYVDPFVRAARDVFKLMMDLETHRGELWACDELIPSKEASVVIGVTGDLLGSILYSFPKEMTLNGGNHVWDGIRRTGQLCRFRPWRGR